MLDLDDAFIKEYLAESREHLADIETDLLTIEAAGANFDENLVNKVFRAAHSIKGGAGFFNLHKIQELAHRTENALDMIRSGEMVPAPDVINVLLMAFDRLRDLLNNYQVSHQADTTEILVALAGMVAANLEPAKKESLVRTVNVTAPGVKTVLHIPEFDFDRARDGRHFMYLVEYDLIDDVQRRGKRPLDVLFMLSHSGTILEAMFDLESAGTLDDEPSTRLPFIVLFCTELAPQMADVIFDVPENQVHVIYSPEEDSTPKPVRAASPPTESLLLDEAEIQMLRDADLSLNQFDFMPNTPEPPKPAASLPPQPPAPSFAPPPVPVQTPAASIPAAESASASASGLESTLRVDVSVLESLMNLAGELVLSRNQLLDAMASGDVHTMQIGAQRINLVTSELQENIMLTRMQPVSNIFNKFPRVVRDLAKELGKEIRLEISGREVEMDKTIIEGLSEPMTHMVRNAVDHGIERADVRTRAGKPAHGTIHLKAYHEAGQVVVEILDDGKGIDPEKVAASALSKGLITADQLRGMSAKEKTALIFLPGLSTAEKVSDVSGRGVGMDVVKTNLDKLGGKVEVDSVPGRGTDIIIRLPLTLAIIPSLLLSVGNERFAIPQVHVSELIHISADQIQKRIEIVGNSEVLMLRGELIPLVRLSDILGIEKIVDEAGVDDQRARLADRRSPRYTMNGSTPIVERGARGSKISQRSGEERRYHASSSLNIVVITTGAMQYGLIVDQLHDTVEIVVKPLGRHFMGMREYAGATILGDGNVALILDAAGIAVKRGLVSMSGSRRAQELREQTIREESRDRQSLLTFLNAPNEHCAMPMDQVVRVLQVEGHQIEWVGGRRTMQYRNSSLSLVTLRDTANVMELFPEQEKAVVICNVFGHEVGLLAGMPVDVLETTAQVDQLTLRQNGVAGSAIIDGHTTLIVDIQEIVRATHPHWAAEQANIEDTSQPESAGSNGVILLAEDSDFFRGRVRRYLEGDGFTVISAVDGQEGWELLDANADRVQLVVTDVEMPRLDGLGLARAIRADQRFGSLPIIALTSLASEDDVARGIAAGVNEYQVKLDHDSLLECIHHLLTQSNGLGSTR